VAANMVFPWHSVENLRIETGYNKVMDFAERQTGVYHTHLKAIERKDCYDGSRNEV
jgi:hypothetical protein